MWWSFTVLPSIPFTKLLVLQCWLKDLTRCSSMLWFRIVSFTSHFAMHFAAQSRLSFIFGVHSLGGETPCKCSTCSDRIHFLPIYNRSGEICTLASVGTTSAYLIVYPGDKNRWSHLTSLIRSLCACTFPHCHFRRKNALRICVFSKDRWEYTWENQT